MKCYSAYVRDIRQLQKYSVNFRRSQKYLRVNETFIEHLPCARQCQKLDTKKRLRGAVALTRVAQWLAGRSLGTPPSGLGAVRSEGVGVAWRRVQVPSQERGEEQ